ncbi:hypothetical protein HPC49_01295 [Pyxidicoccus fallax]|uniref:Lipoprotein n=1 Tax=Pyxidicoccus fallax TaxID=394095 RepID=A0A848L869_9BACT|nr:hypothetical protein [Pyxidicoccus fallax]NMO15190.1 hypothetical protein [Pyxidicoccus fallax]NPC76889.1 hypothetical protein [Pyxidicoccus fallax]
MRLVLLVILAALLGCDVYDRPRRPVGEAFQARALDGAVIDKAVLRGTPWAVNVWVPG